MRAVVIGLGTQGYKRLKSLKKKNLFICSVDPINNDADEKPTKSMIEKGIESWNEAYLFPSERNKKN